jgi:hypothetical protein
MIPTCIGVNDSVNKTGSGRVGAGQGWHLLYVTNSDTRDWSDNQTTAD